MEGIRGKTNLETFQALEKTPLSHWIARRLASLTRPAGVCSCWANRRQPPTQWRWGNKGVSYLGVGVQRKSRLTLGDRRGGPSEPEGWQGVACSRSFLSVQIPPSLIPPSLRSQVAARWPARLSPGWGFKVTKDRVQDPRQVPPRVPTPTAQAANCWKPRPLAVSL